ncbi:Cytoplasmic dynein intermediate chain [Paragonimus heterotremus]|uniref:Cytoplasmic dynein intermediate chain n=1 Tax=Paragonimus heterotremus TaxID=100268 RepID=A0A8J4WHT6_9TREM|nr:Cytoplasmic dynein intermediate chain [Paragonimus heterotremus]
MSTSDRKLELERKKAKLAALREQKTKRDQPSVNVFVNGTNHLSVGPGSTTTNHNIRIDAEELLKTLGISIPESVPNAVGDHVHQSKSASDLLAHTRTSSPRRRAKLGFSKVSELNLPPKDAICYSKETQTRELSVSRNVPGATVSDSPRDILGSPRLMANLEWDDEFSMMMPFDNSLLDPLDRTAMTTDTHRTPLAAGAEPGKHPATPERTQSIKIHMLTDEERATVIQTEQFTSFFDRAARLMERALDEPADIFVDYSGAEHDDASASQRHQLLRFGRDFYDDRWSKRRCVTALDWSPSFPELLLGAYHSNEDAPHEPHGVCLIWNLKYQKSTPEYIFHCQSPVTSATLATYHPNLVIGGTYSGQIVLWDNRTAKRTPVQRTVLSATAHTHPVHGVMIVGTQNAHNLISVSSDGKMCSWSLDMLSQPQQSMELTYRQTRPVATTSLSFFQQDVNNFLVGSEDGRVYTGSRHGNQAGVVEMLEGHQAPITSVSTYDTEGPVNFSSLFLTTSFDWTVKLWSMKDLRPIYSFDESSDIVLDADWSPLHPAVFATVDCSGRLDLWNLNTDTEVPAARIQVDGQVAVNKCRFHSSGLHIAAGDRSGRIHVYDLNESMVTPRTDEWSLFAHTVEELRQLALERCDRDSVPSIVTTGSHMSPIIPQ